AVYALNGRLRGRRNSRRVKISYHVNSIGYTASDVAYRLQLLALRTRLCYGNFEVTTRISTFIGPRDRLHRLAPETPYARDRTAGHGADPTCGRCPIRSERHASFPNENCG